MGNFGVLRYDNAITGKMCCPCRAKKLKIAPPLINSKKGIPGGNKQQTAYILHLL